MRLIRLLLLVLAAMLVWSLPAYAHTSLVSTDPADGDRLDAVPDQIVLTFTENLREPSEAGLVVDGSAAEADVQVDGPRLLVVPAAASEGSYVVNYRVVSADGHPVTGTTSFTVGDEAAAAEPVDSADSATQDVSIWTSPWLWGVVALVVVGGAAIIVLRSGRSSSAR